ncbi:MAG: hypothetical protein JRF72_15550, partial [Deltaproteobacteria bacterium]|nr:hypothetical protein [Deltaproteobacteria bacterium]
MRMGKGSYTCVLLFLMVLVFGATNAQATGATVTLEILNADDDQGDIILAQGDPVEVA